MLSDNRTIASSYHHKRFHESCGVLNGKISRLLNTELLHIASHTFHH
jgi:hypothetical protein